MLNSKGYNDNRMPTPASPVSQSERPDQAQFHIRISVETETASAALVILKRAVSRLEDQLPPFHATLAVTDFDLPAESGKFEAQPSTVQVRVTLPLPLDASPWDRAAKVAQLDDLFRTLIIEGKKQKPKIEGQRTQPIFVLADPEAHRATLIKRLHDRARMLGGGLSINLKDLRFDQPIEQRSIGLEQVELLLRVDGVAEFEVGGTPK